ncbi:MAG: ABC transporter permease [Treponema sp.]|jgi:putative ABC transport system permease protein|nr:ABC transporter permease [Treponema sp.]
MRSLLTSLGIIIGVGSVIIMMAIGEGSQKQIEAQIASMGTNLLQIMPMRMFWRPGQMNANRPRSNQITLKDLEKVRTESSYTLAVSGVTQRSYTVQGFSGAASVQVYGVDPDFTIIKNRRVVSGVLFDDEDLENRNRTAVIGATTALNILGGAESAVGQQIRIGSENFTVTGVLNKAGTSMGQDADDVIWIPLNTFMTRLSNSSNVAQIAVSVVSKKYMSAAQTELSAIMREAHGLRDGSDDDFEIMNSADLVEMATSTAKTLTTLLAAIAGVSLLVGGIGIMNIMLVSVTERTREIGIRMSVGARKRDILFQFLSESVILSLMGGVLGIGMAAAVCRILSMMSIVTAINPLIVAAAAVFAALVGIFFGFYPARKAAALYPIDALRYE